MYMTPQSFILIYFQLLTIEDLVQRHVREQKVAFLRMKVKRGFSLQLELPKTVLCLAGLASQAVTCWSQPL